MALRANNCSLCGVNGRSFIRRWCARTCGSEPAREGGGSATSMLNDIPHSRAGSLPQVDRFRPGF
nr:hypothetical protein FEE99_19195 [Pseudomonas sp. ef1]